MTLEIRGCESRRLRPSPLLATALLPDRTNQAHLAPCQERPALWFFVGLDCLRLDFWKFVNRSSLSGKTLLAAAWFRVSNIAQTAMGHLSIMPLQFKSSRVRRGRYFVDSTETLRHNHETSAIWNMLHWHRRRSDNISVVGGQVSFCCWCSALFQTPHYSPH